MASKYRRILFAHFGNKKKRKKEKKEKYNSYIKSHTDTVNK
jgi:hypothetical protein